MEIIVGNKPVDIPDELIDCEDFVYRVVTIAPDSITMNKDAHVVFKFSRGQETAIGEALNAFSKIKALGVNKPSVLGAALTKLYTSDLIDRIDEIMHGERFTANLMLENRLVDLKKKGYKPRRAWLDGD
jgi:hypothetical protein